MKTSRLIGCLTLVGISVLLVAGVVQVARNSGGPKVRYRSGRTAFLDEVEMPLQASVKVRQSGNRVIFSQDLRDAKGMEIFILPHRPAAPKVEVFDGTGKKVYTCTLEYG